MTNKEKFMKLVSDEKTDTLERNRYRIKNRAKIKEEQKKQIKALLRKDKLSNLEDLQ